MTSPSPDAGEDDVGHALAVARPVGAVLASTAGVVAQGAVNEQDEEVDGVEVGQQVAQACNE